MAATCVSLRMPWAEYAGNPCNVNFAPYAEYAARRTQILTTMQRARIKCTLPCEPFSDKFFFLMKLQI